jgi:hypothetical protein
MCSSSILQDAVSRESNNAQITWCSTSRGLLTGCLPGTVVANDYDVDIAMYRVSAITSTPHSLFFGFYQEDEGESHRYCHTWEGI